MTPRERELAQLQDRQTIETLLRGADSALSLLDPLKQNDGEWQRLYMNISQILNHAIRKARDLSKLYGDGDNREPFQHLRGEIKQRVARFERVVGSTGLDTL